jgi:curved DNA-binding protein CbpA
MDAIEQALETLDLDPGATPIEIKQAYRDLAKVWHPDRFPEDDSRLRKKAEEKLKEINEAYEILKGYNPESRIRSRSTGNRSEKPKPEQQYYRTHTQKQSSQAPPFDLYHSNPEERERQRRALERFLSPVRELLVKLGWPKVWTDQKGNELKCEHNPASPAYRITITGNNTGLFTIRIVPKPDVDLSWLSSLLNRTYLQESAFRGIVKVRGDLNGMKIDSLLLRFTSLSEVLQHTPMVEISDRLLSLVSPAIKALSPDESVRPFRVPG